MNQVTRSWLARRVILLLCAIFFWMIQPTPMQAAPRSLQPGNYDLKVDISRVSDYEADSVIGLGIKLRDIRGKKLSGTATISKSTLTFSFHFPQGCYYKIGKGKSNHLAKSQFIASGSPMGQISVNVQSANKHLARGTFQNYYASGNWTITRKSK